MPEVAGDGKADHSDTEQRGGVLVASAVGDYGPVRPSCQSQPRCAALIPASKRLEALSRSMIEAT